MILQVAGKTYPFVSLVDIQHALTFNQLMAFNRELATHDISTCKKLADVVELLKSIPSLTLDEVKDHPEGFFLLGVMVWAAKVASGERVSLLQACDFRLEDLSFLPEPGEEQGKAPEAE